MWAQLDEAVTLMKRLDWDRMGEEACHTLSMVLDVLFR